MEIGFRDDPIFLLSVEEYEYYKDFIPPYVRGWWLRSSGKYKDSQCTVRDYDYIFHHPEIFVSVTELIRPALNYTNIKSQIIQSTICEDRFIFHDFLFRIIDRTNEIAIAELAIADFEYDIRPTEYEVSSVRRNLLSWYETGIWDYGINDDFRTTIGRHKNPNFTIATSLPDDTDLSLYLEYYDSDNYFTAKHLLLLGLRGPYAVSFKEFRGCTEWTSITKKELQDLCDYLDSYSEDYRAFKVTNWMLTLFHINRELYYLEDKYPNKYSCSLEAFINGFYDYKVNLRDKGFLPSYTPRPDYTVLSDIWVST